VFPKPYDFRDVCLLIFEGNVLTTGYLINKTPSLVLSGKTAYSVLYGRDPASNHL